MTDAELLKSSRVRKFEYYVYDKFEKYGLENWWLNYKNEYNIYAINFAAKCIYIPYERTEELLLTNDTRKLYYEIDKILINIIEYLDNTCLTELKNYYDVECL